MENYSFTSYPDSGESSPRSREIDFDNPPPWDDQPNQNYKAKFMCSYGGKIHPRPHDNQLSYIGGETKILAVDRTTKFNSFISKLAAVCAGVDSDVSFKYQLPGEDLDALISVTNDDDLEHMMHEYDRLYRASAKPARMRLFLFSSPAQSSFGSDVAKSDRERFVDALNSGPTDPPKAPSPNNVDFLFGLEKGVPPPPPQTAVKQQMQESVPEPVGPPPPEFNARVFGSEPVMNPVEIHRQLQEMQRLHIGEQEAAMYRRKSDENLVGAYAGDYYVHNHKMPEKAPPPVTGPPNTGFWQEKQFSGGGYSASAPDQPMYMIPAPGTVYHAAPMVRPVTATNSQGYYHMQRVPSDVYRDQPVYNVVPQPSQPPPSLPPQPPKMTAYSEGFGVVRQGGGGGNNSGMGAVDTGGNYAPMAVTSAYDGTGGRQVYYTAVPTPYQGVSTAVSGDMRPAGAMGQEGNKVVNNKVSQASV